MSFEQSLFLRSATTRRILFYVTWVPSMHHISVVFLCLPIIEGSYKELFQSIHYHQYPRDYNKGRIRTKTEMKGLSDGPQLGHPRVIRRATDTVSPRQRRDEKEIKKQVKSMCCGLRSCEYYCKPNSCAEKHPLV